MFPSSLLDTTDSTQYLQCFTKHTVLQRRESAFDVVVNGGGKFGFLSPLFCHWVVLRACNELHFTPSGPAKQGNASLLSIVVTNCIKGVFNLKFTVCIEESSKKTYVNMNKLANAAWEEG